MSLESENKQYDDLHLKYEVRALRLLLKEFKALFNKIPFDNLSLDLSISRAVIELNINEKELEKILFKIHYSIGFEYGRKVSRQIRIENPIEIKSFKPLLLFDKEYMSYLIDYFRIYGGRQIKGLTKTAVNAVMVEIRKGIKLGETEEQIADRIQKRVGKKEFYNWQAMRIARTETTTAMNAAQEIANITAGVEYDKIWITRMDGKERNSHYAANNQKVTQSGTFLVGGSRMKYPGDRTHGATAKQIVNCRCRHEYKPKREGSGRLVFNDEEEIQEMLLQMRNS